MACITKQHNFVLYFIVYYFFSIFNWLKIKLNLFYEKLPDFLAFYELLIVILARNYIISRIVREHHCTRDNDAVIPKIRKKIKTTINVEATAKVSPFISRGDPSTKCAEIYKLRSNEKTMHIFHKHISFEISCIVFD